MKGFSRASVENPDDARSYWRVVSSSLALTAVLFAVNVGFYLYLESVRPTDAAYIRTNLKHPNKISNRLDHERWMQERPWETIPSDKLVDTVLLINHGHNDRPMKISLISSFSFLLFYILASASAQLWRKN